MIPEQVDGSTLVQLMALAFLAGRGSQGATEPELEHYIAYVLELYRETDDPETLIRWKETKDFNPLEEFGL